MWWRKKVDLVGAAFFAGRLPPTLHSLEWLARAGITVTERQHEKSVWAATLRHPEWGEATLYAPREAHALPSVLIKHATGLTDTERQAISRSADRPLFLEVPARTDDVLRDRKRFLRFLAAVLGRDGVTGIDVRSQLAWTAARLSDELAHDAPLDITQIHVLHVVRGDEGDWVHSHGLGEIGAVDFDVLRPAPALLKEQVDVLRAIAFAVVEGASSGEITPIQGGDPVALVDAATFMESASDADRRLRDPEEHTAQRVVCCDPGGPGFLSRLFGKKGMVPSRQLSRGMVEGRQLVGFSDAATDLCAERARESLSLFDRLTRDFADLRVKPVVKLGYPIDGGTERSHREHLWFEVHGTDGGSIDASLLNEPFQIARMKSGQREKHPVELLSDWAIITPLGQLTPRNLELARKLVEYRPRILEALASRTS